MYDKDRINEEMRMLKGNINRMCLTDSEEELAEMYLIAGKRLTIIYEQNVIRISE